MKSFLDHDLIIDRNFSIHQVIGNYHPPGRVYALKKYILTREHALWKKPGIGYHRLIRIYNPQASRYGEKFFYDPVLKGVFPTITPINIRKHLKPNDGIDRLLSSVKDSLETKTLEIINHLLSIGVKKNQLGLTGSILAGIHNPKISDIDIIIYDCKLLDIIEEARIIEPFKENELKTWIIHNSKRLELPPLVINKLYDHRKRGKYKNTTVSLIPVNKRVLSKEELETKGRYIGTVALLARTNVTSCEHHYYPHIIQARVQKILHSNTSIRTDNLKIISYEGTYINKLLDNSLIRIRGKGYYDNNTLSIIVGAREEKTYLIPIK